MGRTVEVKQVDSRRDLQAFIHFPWNIYRGDPNWVPPLISERRNRLSPDKNAFYSHADVSLFLAYRGRKPVGTIAAFVDHRKNKHFGVKMGGFGFFETIENYGVAEQLLDAACQAARRWGMTGIQGPTNFSFNDEPGILVDGADSPPAILEAHTPPYYREFLERYGMQKHYDVYAWRVSLPELGANLEAIPPQVMQVFQAASQRNDVRVRRIQMDDWEHEVKLVHELYNATHEELAERVPMSADTFRRFAEQMRPLLDPDLVLFAEVDSRAVGFFVAVPDFNRVLWRMNGRLFPFGWAKLWWFSRRIDQISFKILGVSKEYRRQGIDVLMWLEAIRAAANKGYRWLDGSLTSELNPTVSGMAERYGAERYKHYRLYEMMF